MNSPASKRGSVRKALSEADYRTLLEFRISLRRFLNWSGSQAERQGITPTQHLLLLAVRGHGGRPSIAEIAELLDLRHHSAVELADRAEAAGLVRRAHDPADQRKVLLELTSRGLERLETISKANLAELRKLGPPLDRVRKALSSLPENL